VRTRREPTPRERAILELRAAEARAPLPTDAEREERVLWVASFPVGDETYAIPCDDLRGLVPLARVTPVPLAPAHVIGVFRFEEAVIPVMSLATLVGARGWRRDTTLLLLASVAGKRVVAFDVEEAPVAVPVPLRSVEDARKEGDLAVIHVEATDSRRLGLVQIARLLNFQNIETRHGR